MKNTYTGPILSAMLFALLPLLATPGVAQASPEEAELRAEQHEIDRHALNRGQEKKVQILSTQFDVDRRVIERLRKRGQGWGSITIELGLAEQLTHTHPDQFPTFRSALREVDALRREGEGWGNIAKRFGFKLGPVVREVKQTSKQVRAELKGTKPDKHYGNSRTSETKLTRDQRSGSHAVTDGRKDRVRIDSKKLGRVERPTRVDRVKRPDRPPRVVRPPRPERPPRVDRVKRPDRPPRPPKFKK